MRRLHSREHGEEIGPRELKGKALARLRLPSGHKEEGLDCLLGHVGEEWYH